MRRHQKVADEQHVNDVKLVITQAFKELRKKGFLAYQNYLCCQNCGCAALTQRAEELAAKGKPVPEKYVFYHEQDAQNLRQYAEVYLAHGQVNLDPDAEEDDEKGVEIGSEVVSALRKASDDLMKDVDVEWDGDVWKRIKVFHC